MDASAEEVLTADAQGQVALGRFLPPFAQVRLRRQEDGSLVLTPATARAPASDAGTAAPPTPVGKHESERLRTSPARVGGPTFTPPASARLAAAAQELATGSPTTPGRPAAAVEAPLPDWMQQNRAAAAASSRRDAAPSPAAPPTADTSAALPDWMRENREAAAASSRRVAAEVARESHTDWMRQNRAAAAASSRRTATPSASATPSPGAVGPSAPAASAPPASTRPAAGAPASSQQAAPPPAAGGGETGCDGLPEWMRQIRAAQDLLRRRSARSEPIPGL